MQTVCVDFDGVLNEYRGWQGVDYSPSPTKGTKDFLVKLSERYEVVILTARSPEFVTQWLTRYDLLDYVKEVTNVKPPAVAYIDDRAIRYMGDYEATLDQVFNRSEPWWRYYCNRQVHEDEYVVRCSHCYRDNIVSIDHVAFACSCGWTFDIDEERRAVAKSARRQPGF